MVMRNPTQQFVSLADVMEMIEGMEGQVVETGEVGTEAPLGGNILDAKGKSWPIDAFASLLVEVYEGPGSHQSRIIQGNGKDAVVIIGGWEKIIGVGAKFKIKAPLDLRPALREVFGGGSNISAANPLPVDVSPGAKTPTQVLNLATLAAGATSTLANCNTIDLSHGPTTLAITVEATYNAAATRGIRVHVRTSYNGTDYDTEDWDTWDAGFAAGTTIRESEVYETDCFAVKVLIENLDAAQPVTGLRVIATVGA